MRIGVISDTHGLLRPQALEQLQGVEALLHVGDVGSLEILGELGKIAPVTAIRGNIDTRGPCAGLPATEMLEMAGIRIYMLHSVHDLDLDPVSAGVDLVISGHSHQPGVEQRRGVTYLNPGSAGPRRFRLPLSVALVEILGGHLRTEIRELVI